MTTTVRPTHPFAHFPDLASARFGGAVLEANDEFFAEKENLVREAAPIFDPHRYTERGKWMDGWETRRRREPGHDWCIVRLGLPGRVRGVVVDTSFFVGNYPPEFRLESTRLDPGQSWSGDDVSWHELIARSPLEGGAHNPVAVPGEVPYATHLRFSIYPDGGVARLRVYGEVEPPSTTGTLVDLAALEQGGRVVGVSDDFFGHRHNLLLPGPSRGMFDGWETRRRRVPGHDWAVVRLGRAGTIERVEVDTSWFRGNAPGACVLEATSASEWEGHDDWVTLVPRTPLQPDSRHALIPTSGHQPWTFVRLQIHPDGGVARLRLWGQPLEAST